MVPNGPEGNRPAQSEEVAELNEVGGPKRLGSSLSSITSRLSTATGGWGKWLLNSASDFVTELGAESEETTSDLREFCHVIVSDSTAWIRRQAGNHSTDESRDHLTPTDDNNRSAGDDSSSSNASQSSSSAVKSSSIDSRSHKEHSSGNLCCHPHSLGDNITCLGRAETSIPSPLHTAYRQNKHNTEGPLEESNACTLAKAAEPALPIWRTDPAIKRRFQFIATLDASFILDPVRPFPSGCANSTQQQQLQQPAPDDDICEAYLPINVCPAEGDIDAGPSEVDIKEYMKDPYVAAARQRLVPGKVAEKLFWRRFHARVLYMVQEEAQLSVHLSKLEAPTKAVDDSESEKDISWEDLGNDREEALSDAAAF
ncbi:hypothetical protein, conserved [Eimeria praecox]|uniref:BSD domain-containing protein n=1 Tax=Eimeria praecox TaxID=51316 RepID=U6GIH4_9EIME|nr:hypothetical protein, conserved [Eimeria praecox]